LARILGRGTMRQAEMGGLESTFSGHAVELPAVRFPRMRFTLRRMMAAVAGSAVLIWLATCAFPLRPALTC
jgi:hypothetical protein